MTWTRGHALPGNRWDVLDGVEPDEAPAVSVIIAHYCQPEQLARTLYALRRQDHPADRLQIIVADDGSPEAPVVPDGVLLQRQEDKGFRLSAARNLGVRAATGDILVFLDADTAPEPSFIRELVRLPALAPDCVTVGRRRHADLSGVEPTDDIERAVVGRELAEPAWLRGAYEASRNLLDADDRSYRHVIGAVLACSRALFDEVGGFDESFTSYGGEDWEWAYRAWIGGALLAHVPGAVAWHDGPDFAGRSSDHRAQQNAEHMRLSHLIPVPGSGARGLRRDKVDIVVTGPPAGATPGQAFISVDSVLGSLRGAEVPPDSGGPIDPRFDRVRVRVEILRALRADGEGLAASIARLDRERLGELVVTDADGVEVVRITSARAVARASRWGRDDLFRTQQAVGAGLRVVDTDASVAAYLGGWD